MPESSFEASGDAAALGALLVLLHGAGTPTQSVEATYRVWRHQQRLTEAFITAAEEQRRRGGSGKLFSIGSSDNGEPEPDEVEETLRIWREGDRVRVEHHGGERDGAYEVADPPLWWRWDEYMGAMSNEDDPSVGTNVGEDMDIMLDPTPLLSLLRFRVTGSSTVAGRATTTAHATPRPVDPRFGSSFELSRLGSGADYYDLEVDTERGFLLAATAVRNDLPFHKITTLAITFDQPIAPEIFRFEPPEGEEIVSPRDRHRRENVTLVEAQQLAPFTVLMLDRVPEGWQQMHCTFGEASKRPPSPAQIHVNYHSADRHESVNITQMAADSSDQYKDMGGPEDWEDLTRDGITVRTRAANWGQAQVQLERDGTFVFLMSDNLTRDQLVKIAVGLRPAPNTSSV
jgi:hypothetical protein